MERGEMEDNSAAMSIWAPYGMMPCMKQEKVSRMLADLRESILKRPAIFLAIGPVVMTAMVLFAVQRFARQTNPAMLSSPARLELTWRVSFRMM